MAPGQKIKLEIENDSGPLHNFSNPERHVDVNIPRKGEVVVEVSFPSSGVVHFFCKFHESRGMNSERLTGDARPQAVSSENTKKRDRAAGIAQEKDAIVEIWDHREFVGSRREESLDE